MKNIAEMTKEEFEAYYPLEDCPKHGPYRVICMTCDREADMWLDAQDYKKACLEEMNREVKYEW